MFPGRDNEVVLSKNSVLCISCLLSVVFRMFVNDITVCLYSNMCLDVFRLNTFCIIQERSEVLHLCPARYKIIRIVYISLKYLIYFLHAFICI